MPPKKKRTRASVPPPPLPHSEHDAVTRPAADSYQLTVVNSCTTSEDIRLPSAPSPALLSTFYAQYDTPVEAGCCESALASSAAPLAPWTTTYWLRRVAHVPLGRHSALPVAYRLRHDCISRLHARVVYVRTPAMHKRFAKYFPFVARDAAGEQRSVSSSREVDDVVVVDSAPSSPSTTPPPSPPGGGAALPYYLIVNYSENPVYVGRHRVGRGRSAVLCEGDVISFLECAFDDDGGMLADAAEEALVAEENEEEGAAKSTHGELAEPLDQLLHASLSHCLTTTTSSPSAPLLLPLFVERRCVARRRPYEVATAAQEYLRWWVAQWHQERQRGADAVTVLGERSPLSFSPLLVRHNHLVRASSLASSTDAVPVTPGRLSTQAAEWKEAPAPDRVGEDAEGLPADMAAVGSFIAAALQQPLTAAALRQWLDSAEDLEEMTDDVVSPLCARLVLDRAALRRLARQRTRQPTSESPRGATPKAGLRSLPVKVEEEGEGGSARKAVQEATLLPSAAMEVAESFRVSLSPTPTRAGATPPREPSAVRAVMHQLRRSLTASAEKPSSAVKKEGEGEDDTVAAKVVAASGSAVPVRRSLRLDDNPIELFTTTAAVAESAPRSSDGLSPRAASWGEGPSPLPMAARAGAGGCGGVPTPIPGVCMTPAALPVYVFTRRSRSPEVYTRDAANLRILASTAGGKAVLSAGAANAAQYVYYFEPEDEQGRENAQQPGKGERLENSSGAVATAASTHKGVAEAEADGTEADDVGWIDETVKPRPAGAAVKGKKTGKRRRRRLP